MGSDGCITCDDHRLSRVAVTTLPTRYGTFKLRAYQEGGGPTHLALIVGNPKGRAGVPVRLHSECVTGDVFGSLRCDCGPQLEKALRHFQRKGLGILIHLDQEGRGIGLANKMRAYALQDEGLDTVEANLRLGFAEDKRDYNAAASILRDIGVKSIRLMTNNPLKLENLRLCGIEIVERVPHAIPPNKVNRRYLKTKKDRMGHLLGKL